MKKFLSGLGLKFTGFNTIHQPRATNGKNAGIVTETLYETEVASGMSGTGRGNHADAFIFGKADGRFNGGFHTDNNAFRPLLT